jgi:SP family sugar:H+ symporter-like MFS transporter
MGFLSLKKPDDEVGAAWPSIMVGAFAAFAGILYGYDTGTSPIIYDRLLYIILIN